MKCAKETVIEMKIAKATSNVIDVRETTIHPFRDAVVWEIKVRLCHHMCALLSSVP